MSRIVPATAFFSATRPPVVGIAHLVTALDAEFIGKVAHLTKCPLGLWPLPAPFDEEDRFDNARDGAPFLAWALPLNQREVLGFGPLVQEAVFGGKVMLADAEFDENTLARLAVSPGRRLETGAWVTRDYQDLPELQELVELCGWLLIPIGPERSLGLFVVSEAKADWITKLIEWCNHEGRSRGQFCYEGDRAVLMEEPAPENYRRNAMDHHIDAFLSRLEIHFGAVDESVPAAVKERIEARHKLRQQVAQLRGRSPDS
jgi:hypothetical protein